MLLGALRAAVTELHDENFEEFCADRMGLVVLFHAGDAAASEAFDAQAVRAAAVWPELAFAAFDLSVSEEPLHHFGLSHLPAIVVFNGDLRRKHEGLRAADIPAVMEGVLAALPRGLEEEQRLREFLDQPAAVLLTLGTNATDFHATLRALALHHSPLPFAHTSNTRFRHADEPDTAPYVLSVYRDHGRKHHTLTAKELLLHTFSEFVGKHSAPSLTELGPDSSADALHGRSLLALLVAEDAQGHLFDAFERLAYSHGGKVGFFWWRAARPPPPALLARLSPHADLAPPLVFMVELRGQRVLHYPCPHRDRHGLHVCLHAFLGSHARPSLSSQPLGEEGPVAGVQRVVGLSFQRIVLDFPGHVALALTKTGSRLSDAVRGHLQTLAANPGPEGDLRVAEMSCDHNHVEELAEAHCPGLYVFPAAHKARHVRCLHALELRSVLDCLRAATGKQFPWLEGREEL